MRVCYFVQLSKTYGPDPASARVVDKISFSESESRIMPSAQHPVLFSVSTAFSTGVLQPY